MKTVELRGLMNWKDGYAITDLDSCRNLLTGLSDSMLSLLLCVLNRAARVSLSKAK